MSHQHREMGRDACIGGGHRATRSWNGEERLKDHGFRLGERGEGTVYLYKCLIAAQFMMLPFESSL